MATNNSRPVVIALFGAIGAGKSTFINNASGSTLSVGHSQQPCTEQVQFATPFELDGREIRLIDSPGFDDTTISDVDVLERIDKFLKLSDIERLSGIIYMHRITDSRASGTSRINFRAYQELCGEFTLKNVIITTNMWTDPLPEFLLARERELGESPDFFQPAIAKGARMTRYVRSQGSNAAHDIIRMLMVDGVPLGNPNSGESGNEKLRQQVERLKTEVEALRWDVRGTKEELEAERRLSQERLEEANGQRRLSRERLEKLEAERRLSQERLEEANAQRRLSRERLEQLEAETRKSQKLLEEISCHREMFRASLEKERQEIEAVSRERYERLAREHENEMCRMRAIEEKFAKAHATLEKLHARL